jgi:hypothetical protein
VTPRPSTRLLIELAKMVARDDPGKATKPGQMAHDALAALTREDSVSAAAQAGGNTIHTDSGRTPPAHNPGGFPGTESK